MAKKFIKSLKNAFNGLALVLTEEQNFKIHTAMALLVVAAGFWFEVSRFEWLALTMAIILVFVMETINSIFERVIDMIKPSHNQYVKDMKDMMAGSVLLAVVGAVFIGCIIFLPKIFF